MKSPRNDEENQPLSGQLKSLWRIARMTNASHTELCKLVLEEIQKLTNSQSAFIGLPNEDESGLLLQSWSKTAAARGAVGDGPKHVPIQQAGLWRRAILERQPWVVNDYHQSHAHKTGLPEGYMPLQRFLAVPILEEDRVVALAAVADKADNYTNEDVSQVHSFVADIFPIIEKRRSEEMHKERAQTYRMALETAHGGLILQAASGEILTWNKGAQEIFGISAEEATGETAIGKGWSVIREDGSKYDQDDYPSRRTLRTGLPYRNEIMGRYLPDGTLRWISVNSNPLFHANESSPYAVAVSFADITDLKKERDLSQTYLDIAGVMLMALNTNGDVVSINKKGCEILEASEEDLLGKNWFETFLPEALIEDVRQVFGELMAGRIAPVEYYETTVLTLTGKQRVIAWHNTVLKNNRGEITGTFSSGEDITERKLAEQALQKSAEQHRSILETAMDGYWMTDLTGRFLEVNQTYCRMSGYSEQELLTMKIADVEALETEDQVSARAKMLAATGEERFESRHRRKDGTLYDIEASVQYRASDGGRFICFIRDITEYKKMEAERLEFERRNHQIAKIESLSRMAGAVAHHYNNLLTVVLGYLELAMDVLPLQGDTIQFLVAAKEEAQRAATLGEKMLVFLGQLPQGKYERLNLARICHKHCATLHPKIPDGVTLKTDLPSPGPFIRADRNQLDQILTHLITNAVEAIKAFPGVVQVRVGEMKGTKIPKNNRRPMVWEPSAEIYACLCVKDSGCGMDAATLNQIFDPFFTEKFMGRGLGLPVTLGIVKSLEGCITVTSKPEQGSAIRVYLPVDPTLIFS